MSNQMSLTNFMVFGDSYKRFREEKETIVQRVVELGDCKEASEGDSDEVPSP